MLRHRPPENCGDLPNRFAHLLLRAELPAMALFDTSGKKETNLCENTASPLFRLMASALK